MFDNGEGKFLRLGEGKGFGNYGGYWRIGMRK